MQAALMNRLTLCASEADAREGLRTGALELVDVRCATDGDGVWTSITSGELSQALVV